MYIPVPQTGFSPMAGRIADGQEYGLILGFGALKGCVAPRPPVNWVVSVLLKVGGCFVYQSIGYFR